MANLQLIKKLADERGIQLNQLADMAKLSRQTIFQMVRNNSGTIASLEAIARALDVPTGIFFDDYNSGSTVLGDTNIVNSPKSKIGYVSPDTIALLKETISLLKERIADKDEIIAVLKSKLD